MLHWTCLKLIFKLNWVKLLWTNLQWIFQRVHENKMLWSSSAQPWTRILSWLANHQTTKMDKSVLLYPALLFEAYCWPMNVLRQHSRKEIDRKSGLVSSILLSFPPSSLSLYWHRANSVWCLPKMEKLYYWSLVNFLLL